MAPRTVPQAGFTGSPIVLALTAALLAWPLGADAGVFYGTGSWSCTAPGGPALTAEGATLGECLGSLAIQRCAARRAGMACIHQLAGITKVDVQPAGHALLQRLRQREPERSEAAVDVLVHAAQGALRVLADNRPLNPALAPARAAMLSKGGGVWCAAEDHAGERPSQRTYAWGPDPEQCYADALLMMRPALAPGQPRADVVDLVPLGHGLVLSLVEAVPTGDPPPLDAIHRRAEARSRALRGLMLPPPAPPASPTAAPAPGAADHPARRGTAGPR